MQSVSQKIIQHLGGMRRLSSMVNAKQFMSGNDASTELFGNLNGSEFLRFRFSGSRKANMCVIVFDRGKDLYNVYTMKVTTTIAKVITRHEGVGVENLISTFESATDLYLTFR